MINRCWCMVTSHFDNISSRNVWITSSVRTFSNMQCITYAHVSVLPKELWFITLFSNTRRYQCFHKPSVKVLLINFQPTISISHVTVLSLTCTVNNLTSVWFIEFLLQSGRLLYGNQSFERCWRLWSTQSLQISIYMRENVTHVNMNVRNKLGSPGLTQNWIYI